jgi:predicted DNA binding CopG/RHH family protein
MLKKSKFTLYIDEELLNELKKQAIDEGCSYSEWIEKAIELYLEYGLKGKFEEE